MTVKALDASAVSVPRWKFKLGGYSWGGNSPRNWASAEFTFSIFYDGNAHTDVPVRLQKYNSGADIGPNAD